MSYIFWNCAQFSSARYPILLDSNHCLYFHHSLMLSHFVSHSSVGKFHYWRFWCLLWVNKRPNHIDYSSLSSHNIKWQQRMFFQQSDKCVVALCSKITFILVYSVKCRYIDFFYSSKGNLRLRYLVLEELQFLILIFNFYIYFKIWNIHMSWWLLFTIIQILQKKQRIKINLFFFCNLPTVSYQNTCILFDICEWSQIKIWI